VHEAIYYYGADALDAVRVGKWKLHVGRKTWTTNDCGLTELYDLENDPSESVDRSAAHGDVVRALMRAVDRGRADSGDVSTGASGKDRRPIGRVRDPRPLTTFDPDRPYFKAVYDLADVG
jgi:arylsulfatase A